MSNPVPSSLALGTISGEIAASPHNSNNSSVQTAVNALITALGGGTANYFLQAVDSTHVQWAGAYTTYTPTWTSSGVAPAIGNGTNTAHYLQIGKLVHAWGALTFGTTTTYGTGLYTIALPVAPSASIVRTIGLCEMYDSSTGNFVVASAQPIGSTFNPIYASTYLGPASAISNTVPWTWATSDYISWNLTYEAA